MWVSRHLPSCSCNKSCTLSSYKKFVYHVWYFAYNTCQGFIFNGNSFRQIYFGPMLIPSQRAKGIPTSIRVPFPTTIMTTKRLYLQRHINTNSSHVQGQWEPARPAADFPARRAVTACSHGDATRRDTQHLAEGLVQPSEVVFCC